MVISTDAKKPYISIIIHDKNSQKKQTQKRNRSELS